nr:MAG TPA: hypothetical protein [Caudoviricetes sp.]
MVMSNSYVNIKFSFIYGTNNYLCFIQFVK